MLTAQNLESGKPVETLTILTNIETPKGQNDSDSPSPASDGLAWQLSQR